MRISEWSSDVCSSYLRPRDLLRAGVLRCGNEVVQPAGQGTPGVGRSRRVRSRGVGYDATCPTKKEEPMARKPNYDFERNERERLKAEKKAKTADEKTERTEEDRVGTECDRSSRTRWT